MKTSPSYCAFSLPLGGFKSDLQRPSALQHLASGGDPVEVPFSDAERT